MTQSGGTDSDGIHRSGGGDNTTSRSLPDSPIVNLTRGGIAVLPGVEAMFKASPPSFVIHKEKWCSYCATTVYEHGKQISNIKRRASGFKKSRWNSPVPHIID